MVVGKEGHNPQGGRHVHVAEADPLVATQLEYFLKLVQGGSAPVALPARSAPVPCCILFSLHRVTRFFWILLVKPQIVIAGSKADLALLPLERADCPAQDL